MSFQESLHLQLLGGSRAMIEGMLAEAYAASTPRTPGVNILTAQDGCWSSSSWQHKRPLGSLVLGEGVLEDALADLRDFYHSGVWYAERGIPYRPATCCTGRPGRGRRPWCWPWRGS
jgi:chaperone BCS1